MSGLAEEFVVPSDQVEAAWPALAAIVSRVTDISWSLEEIRIELSERRAQAWGVRHGDEIVAVIVTRVETTPSHRYGLVWLAAGTALEEGMRMFRERIEPWLFEDMGCEWIEIQGRKGWRKMLPEYQQPAVVLRKFRQVH